MALADWRGPSALKIGESKTDFDFPDVRQQPLRQMHVIEEAVNEIAVVALPQRMVFPALKYILVGRPISVARIVSHVAKRRADPKTHRLLVVAAGTIEAPSRTGFEQDGELAIIRHRPVDQPLFTMVRQSAFCGVG
jgi:hypothetical protein